MLDFVTSSRAAPSAVLLTGSAGYGISTILMATALNMVRQKAGMVFLLKSGHQLYEGDIEYAVSIFPKEKLLFFVDNAAEASRQLQDTIGKLRDKGQTALFILGERLNEWRQSPNLPRVRELMIDPLSDDEIIRLVRFLEENGQLNALGPLNPQMRFNAIKRIYNKELLVVLREATEGEALTLSLKMSTAELETMFLENCTLLFVASTKAMLLAQGQCTL